ncbi:hypothetical protein RTM1035_14867 [Roseovarius sp. TM1035]|nr:hypothetical protein RTM1035_14867 [Roseovarius sp. TM1035]
MPNRPVVALDISVLLGLAGLDVLDRNSMFLNPFSQHFADLFGAVVDPDRPGLSAPFYDPVQTTDDPFCRKREINLDPQSLTVEVIQYVQKPERTSIADVTQRVISLAIGFGPQGEQRVISRLVLKLRNGSGLLISSRYKSPASRLKLVLSDSAAA